MSVKHTQIDEIKELLLRIDSTTQASPRSRHAMMINDTMADRVGPLIKGDSRVSGFEKKAEKPESRKDNKIVPLN